MKAFPLLIMLLLLAPTLYAGEGGAATEPRDLKHESYLEIGAFLSDPTPSPAVGYWFGPFGVRISGMYWSEDKNKIHLNLGYKRLDTERKQRSVNLLLSKNVGSDPGADYDFTSLGLAYSWNTLFGIRGLFLEFGLARVLHDNIGNVEDELVVPVGQLGYIYRFTPK